MADKKDRPLEPAEVAHLEAQAEKERAEAEKFHYEASIAKAKARIAEAEAKVCAIEADEADESRQRKLLHDDRFHVYNFDKAVTEASSKACINKLNEWTRADEKVEIELQINSPGGEIFSGLALFDHLINLRAEGHKITTVALGMAASMAGVLLQAGDTRVMGANCMMLIHEGALGAIGDFDAVKDRVKLMELFHDRILGIFEERARPINSKTTKRYIKTRWARKDWWFTAQDALKLGFVDEVRG